MTQQILLKLEEYQNPDLIQLFTQRDGQHLSENEVSELFADLKKLLFINFLMTEKGSQNKSFYLTPELDLIDQIWHQFILMTEDYQNFCTSVFGRFLHHRPEIPNDSEKESNFDIEWQINLIERTFGIPTVTRWYLELPALNQKRRSLVEKIKKALYEN